MEEESLEARYLKSISDDCELCYMGVRAYRRTVEETLKTLEGILNDERKDLVLKAQSLCTGCDFSTPKIYDFLRALHF